MTETTLIHTIQKLKQNRPNDLKISIGDDCSVIAVGKKEILITCDALVEGIHFKRKWASWENWGKKAAGGALSDIAAMGGSPKFGWLHLSIPKNLKEREIKKFISGLLNVFKKFRVVLAGGNISTSPKGFQSVLTIWGERPKGVKMLRSSAKPGDGVYIGGPVGHAAKGLKLLNKKAPSPFPLPSRERVRGKYIQSFLNPQPQIALGLWLAKNKIANACIDVSDGLLKDLNHIALASKVKIVLADTIVSPELTSGEDYVLAFTAPRSKEKLLTRRKRIKKIGVVKKGKPVYFAKSGFEHL